MKVKKLEIIRQALSARQTGKTYTLLEGMKANPMAGMIVHSQQRAKDLSKQSGLPLKRFFVISKPEQIYGHRGPFIIEDYFMEMAAYEGLEAYARGIKAGYEEFKREYETRFEAKWPVKGESL